MYLNIIRYFENYKFVLYIRQIHLLFTNLTTSQDLPEGNWLLPAMVWSLERVNVLNGGMQDGCCCLFIGNIGLQNDSWEINKLGRYLLDTRSFTIRQCRAPDYLVVVLFIYTMFFYTELQWVHLVPTS